MIFDGDYDTSEIQKEIQKIMKEKEEEIERQKNELIKKKDEENRAQQQWEQNKEAIQIARRKEKYIEYIDGKKTFEKK